MRQIRNVLFFLLGFTLVVSCAAAMAGDTAPDDPSKISVDATVLTFIHVMGCPRGKQELFVFFNDHGKTKVLHLIDGQIPPLQEALKKTIGDVGGYNRTFNCGTSA